MLVLASGSPYRRQLLDKLALPYQTCAPNIDESRHGNEAPDDYVARLAHEKAQAVARQYPRARIIGSDQAAVLDGRILGKPGNHERAREQLTAASGRTVLFLTGLCLYNAASGAEYREVVPFRVHFRTLEADAIERYLRQETPYDCAGSFKSEGFGITLFERLEGDDPNALIGLPLIRLAAMLRADGIPLP